MDELYHGLEDSPLTPKLEGCAVLEVMSKSPNVRSVQLSAWKAVGFGKHPDYAHRSKNDRLCMATTNHFEHVTHLTLNLLDIVHFTMRDAAPLFPMTRYWRDILSAMPSLIDLELRETISTKSESNWKPWDINGTFI